MSIDNMVYIVSSTNQAGQVTRVLTLFAKEAVAVINFIQANGWKAGVDFNHRPHRDPAEVRRAVCMYEDALVVGAPNFCWG